MTSEKPAHRGGIRRRPTALRGRRPDAVDWISWRYYTSAVLLSIAWYGVVHLSPFLRISVQSNGIMEIGTTGTMALFAAAGLPVAAVFRRPIVCARGAMHLVLGAVLPYVAAVIFLILTSCVVSIRRGSFHEALVLPFWGLWFTVLSCFVVIPFGVLCQLLLSASGRRGKLQRQDVGRD